jgi:hypothetical protein
MKLVVDQVFSLHEDLGSISRTISGEKSGRLVQMSNLIVGLRVGDYQNVQIIKPVNYD